MPSGCAGDVFLFMARIRVTCPDCAAVNFLTHERHKLHLNVFGISALKPWSCHSCGYAGRIVKAHNVTFGRVSIPPSGAIVALREDQLPKRDYDAWREATAKGGGKVRGDVVRFPARASVVPTRRDLDNAETCSERRRHGFFASEGKLRCPMCAFPFFNVNVPVAPTPALEGPLRTTS